MQQIQGAFGETEFLDALRSTRRAKNVLMVLIMLALAVQMAAMVVVRFTGAMDGTTARARAVAARGAPAAPVTTRPGTTQPATAPAEPSANAWERLFGWLLPAMKFLALAAGLLLVLTIMFAVKIALHGRTGGTAGFISAFYWSLVLLLPLVPWQQVMPGSSVLAGALYNLGDLARATARVSWGAEASFLGHVMYFVRFLVYPVVTFALMGVVCSKFTRGWRRATVGVQPAETPPAAGVEKM